MLIHPPLAILQLPLMPRLHFSWMVYQLNMILEGPGIVIVACTINIVLLVHKGILPLLHRLYRGIIAANK